MRNTKSKIIIVMCIALCLMVVGYAAFSTSLSITGTSNITSQWNVVFTKIEEVSKTSGVTIINTPTASGTSATFNVGLALPGDKIVYQITIENKGTIDAKVQNIVASASDSPAIIYGMSGIKIGEEIKKQTTKTFTVTIEYDPFITTQPEKTNKTLTVDITIVQSTGASSSLNDPTIDQPLYEYSFLSGAILTDNIAYADNVSSTYVSSSTGIDFGQISSSSNGKGLYYTSTNTEGNLPTYYFRGEVENNYVKFGKDSSGNDILWRIVRINEDGSIRLITQNSVGTSAFNENSEDNAYLGYMYGTPGSSTYAATHANTNDSTIKDYIDNWYSSNLSNYSSCLADAGFCNDRSLYSGKGYNGNDEDYSEYGAYNRLKINSNPQFLCPQQNDFFTLIGGIKGNKSLTHPIGLLTADEVVYAGGSYQNSGSSSGAFYLYGDTNSEFWTMTPFSLAYEFTQLLYTYINGIYEVSSYREFKVRPVINLNSNVQLTDEIPSGCTKQNGTASCPYIINTN